jgi:hypothetical protein
MLQASIRARRTYRAARRSVTENKASAYAKIPKGMDKDQFKTEFRESFVKGYTNAYKCQ